MRIRHAHYSLLGSTSTAVLLSVLRALLALLRGTDVLTLTEVGTGRRAAVLGRLPGYQLVWLPGPTGEGECGLLFARWKWRMVDARTTQRSTSGVPRRGGVLVHSLDVILEHRASLARHLFSVAHLPSGVEGRLRWSSNRAQVVAHQEALRSWAKSAAAWHKSGKYAGVHLVADWNLCWLLPWVRSLLTDLFPGFASTWAGRATGAGTHGSRFIDFTLTTCLVVRARVLRRRTASDHRPYRNVLSTRRRITVFPSITWRVVRRARRRGVTVLTRRQWGAKHQAVYAWRRKNKPHLRLPHTPADTMVQHITVTLDHGPLTGHFVTDVQTVERIGFERFGSGISYNWVVDMVTGLVAQGMPLDAKGTHTVNDKNVPGYSKDQNAVALAIAVLGMPGDKLSAKAEAAITQLLVAHVRAGALTIGFDYDPHSKFAFKDCPCGPTRDAMSRIRGNVAKALAR